MSVKYTAQQLKALATYSALVAKARAVTGAVEVSNKTMVAFAQAAALSAIGTTNSISVAVKAALLQAEAATGHYFTLLELEDAFSVVDLQRFDLSKLRTDEVRAVEQALISLTKQLADNAATIDVARRLVGKELAHTATTSENRTFNTDKALQDTSQTQTQTDKFFGAAKDDSVAVSEQSVRAAGKGLIDNTLTQDVFDRTVAFVRLFEDIVDGTDEINAALLMDDGEVFFLQKNFLDAATATTQLAYDIARVSADTAVALTDTVLDSAKILADVFAASTRTDLDLGKTLQDPVGSTTLTTAETGKSLTDTPQTSVSATFEASKPLSDVALTSTDTTNLVGKSVVDSAQTNVQLNFDAGKTLADGASLSDLRHFDMSRVSADAAAMADSLATTFSKTVADSVQVTDTVYFYFAVSAFDTTTTAEIVNIVRIAAGGVPAQFENQYATDTSSLGINKNFTDFIAATDNFDGTLTTEDDQTATFYKNVVEPLTLIEVQKFDLQRTLSETLGADDSGYLFLTDYCDSTYFSQSYVGQERIFT